jgi:hypothetical protein
MLEAEAAEILGELEKHANMQLLLLLFLQALCVVP